MQPVRVGAMRTAGIPDPDRTGVTRGEQLLTRVLGGPARAGADGSPVTHVERVPARSGTPVDWPHWVPPLLAERLRLRGVQRPWRHQVDAAELAWAGESVVLATGTASGKSLGYQLPVLATLLADQRPTTETPRSRSATGCGRTLVGSSPTRTCCTTASCRHTPGGPASCAGCG